MLLLLLLLLLFDGGDDGGDDDEVGVDDAYDTILVRYWPSVHRFVRIHGDRKSPSVGPVVPLPKWPRWPLNGGYKDYTLED